MTFRGFVVLAEMRTGSNALEEAINLFDGLMCHGEAFNNAFVGHQGQTKLLGISMAERQRAPDALLDAILAEDGVNGFRYFHDHDPRVTDRVLTDKSIAKVILRRDPLDAFVSRKIAETTGQWKLTDARDRKRARIFFDPVEYEAVAATQAAFRGRVRRALQESGQTAFHIDYSEITDTKILEGLASFLGCPQRLAKLKIKLKRQNPEPLSEKVLNPEALDTVVSQSAGSATAAEPARGANVGSWVAGANAPVLFMPVKGGPSERIEGWLGALDGASPEQLTRGFTQKTLRTWKNQNKDARSFTVVSHPVERAHRVFCQYILSTGPGSFLKIRQSLRAHYDIPLPEQTPGASWSPSEHRTAFLGFLRFAKANNDGQTSLRSDPAWSSQSALLAGISQVLPPDLIVRETEAQTMLNQLADRLGAQKHLVPDALPIGPLALSEIYDSEIEDAVRSLHGRDFMAFGFRRWSAPTERKGPQA